ncbi:MAG: hypothetical protein D6E12_18420, partial [Desulfovibrio sp.]
TVLESSTGGASPVVYPPGDNKPDALLPEYMVNVHEEATPFFIVLGRAGGDIGLDLNVDLLLCSEERCQPLAFELQLAWPDVDPSGLAVAETEPWWLTFQVAMLSRPDQGGEEQGASGTGAVQESGGIEGAGEVAGGGLDLSTITPRFFQPDLEVRGFGKAVLFALLAGLILNFMPCVLPVISLKLSSLVAAAGLDSEAERKSAFQQHNLMFSLGILTFFVALATLLWSLGVAGMAWGRLFQEPSVVLALLGLVFVLGLSLFGVFDLPIIDLKPSKGNGHSASNAFFTGVVATLLATPCSGPFLGGVLVWAVSQPPLVLGLVFFSIGVGMASPYLVMVFFPGLVRVFPKPGAWTLYLQRFVAFFLMATSVYLLSILDQTMWLSALIFLLVLSFAAWIWGGWTSLADSRLRRWLVRGLALVVAVVGAWLLFAPSEESGVVAWEEFSAQGFAEVVGQEPLLIDFTADWCPTCKVLESTVLTDSNLEVWAAQYGLRFIKADMTRDNPTAEALLNSLGSTSIPVVAIFPAGDMANEPLVLRDIFTQGIIEDALAEALP